MTAGWRALAVTTAVALALAPALGAAPAHAVERPLGPVMPPSATRTSAPVTGPKVVVVGDIACPPAAATTSSRCRQGATARLARRLKPRRVLAVGDLQYDKGELKNFRRSYDKSWGRLKQITRPVPGNHEYYTSGASGYYTYFGLTSPGYRAVRIGTWRVYLLNSVCSEIDCAAERVWLRQDMNANPVRCSAVVMHYPRYSSGEHGSDPGMTRFWRIAHRHGADVALAGHDHDYERFAPMDAVGNVRRGGLRSFVVGTGGKSLYRKKSSATGSRYFRADKFGVLLMRLGDGRYSWRFRALGGTVRDSGSARCH
jgi:Calcineurin-like phosphoesterase